MTSNRIVELKEAIINANKAYREGGSKEQKENIISDATFDGVYTNQSIFSSDEMSMTDTIAGAVSNISEDYFKFLDLRKRGGNIFSELVSEPISYPTNIKNGYGFFNTHYPDIEIFDLNNY
jgi:hypothetical protein